MQVQAGPAYAAVSQLWNAVYDAPPPPDCDAGEILDALIGAMEPLAYDQFYQPYVRHDGTLAPPDVPHPSIPSPARVRALDVALRSMLGSCPVPDRLRSLVEQIDVTAFVVPGMRLDGVDADPAQATERLLSH
jgi:hypothetical protein